MSQPTLFGDEPPRENKRFAFPFGSLAPATATADPATSAAAEAEHTASGVRGEHCQRVLGLVRQMPGSTYVELTVEGQAGHMSPLDKHEIMRRLNDLRQAGLVRHGTPRRCRIKSRSMVTWWAI